jgi:hypothetical protein
MIIVIVVVDYRDCAEGSKLVGKTLSVVPGSILYCRPIDKGPSFLSYYFIYAISRLLGLAISLVRCTALAVYC